MNETRGQWDYGLTTGKKSTHTEKSISQIFIIPYDK